MLILVCTAAVVVGLGFHCTDVFSVIVVVEVFNSVCLFPMLLCFSSFYLFDVSIVFLYQYIFAWNQVKVPYDQILDIQFFTFSHTII